MTIFYFFRELNTPMYWWQRIHFFDELERNNIHIITFNPLDYQDLDEANDKLLDVMKETPQIDLFMNCDDSDCLYKESIKQINKMGIPSLLICWDNLEVPFKHKAIAPYFDIVWITSIETKYLFEKWGCKNIIFQSFAANPYVFNQQNNVNQINTVGFIGSPYGSRVNKINELLTNGISCSVYSDSLFKVGYNTSQGGVQKYHLYDVARKAVRYMRFPIGRQVLYTTIKNKLINKPSLYTDSSYLNCEKSVSDREMIRLYNEFALSLNISELRDTYISRKPIHKVHLRAFEIPMSGGLEFASYTKEVASYFEDGTEIVLYHTGEEMIDKAKFYLNPKNETTVTKMKQAARARALKEHTWMNRFDTVFKCLK